MVFISLFVFSFILIRNQKAELSREIIERGKVFAEFSANPMYRDYVMFYSHPTEGEFERFREELKYKLQKDKDVVKATLFAINGKVLFDSDEVFRNERYKGEARYIRDEGALRLAKREEVSYRETKIDDRKAVEIFAPVKETTGSHIMSVRYVVSYEFLEERMWIAYRQILLASVIVFSAAFLLTVSFSVTLTKPIVRLTSLTEKISKGDLDMKIRINSKDEIGQLARSFNMMADNLKKYRKKREAYRQELERRVEERTKDLNDKNSQLKKLNKTLKERYSEIERFGKLLVGRELKMKQMKIEAKEMEKRIGELEKQLEG